MENILEQLNRIEVLIERQCILSKEILSLEEAAVYLLLSKSALYKATSNKEMPFYVPGGKKIYFRKTELDNWVFKSRINPVGELNQEVESYLSRTQKSKP